MGKYQKQAQSTQPITIESVDDMDLDVWSELPIEDQNRIFKEAYGLPPPTSPLLPDDERKRRQDDLETRLQTMSKFCKNGHERAIHERWWGCQECKRASDRRGREARQCGN